MTSSQPVTTLFPVGTRVRNVKTDALGTVTDSWMGYGDVAGAQVKWDDKPGRSSVLAATLTAE